MSAASSLLQKIGEFDPEVHKTDGPRQEK